MKTAFRLPAFMALFAAATALCATTGSVEFTVTTKPMKGKYSPRHVLAIWVTKSNGDFVRTLQVQGRKRVKYLKTWAGQSGKDKVDAVTGATLKAHGGHTVTWDCRDTRGELVPDGDYQIHVEFTSMNGQGPVTPPSHIQFTKGQHAVSLAPEGLPFLDEMKLEYTPSDETSVSTRTRDRHP